MKPMSDIFLASKPSISTNRINIDSGTPETTRSKDSTIKRIPRDELELAYSCDPINYNSVNKIVQMIMSGEYSIEAKSKRVETYFNMFTKRLGTNGSTMTWEALLESIYKNALVFGASFVENVFNKQNNRVVEWDIIDSKKIDYAKDGQENIVINSNNECVGYFQLLCYNNTSESGEKKAAKNSKFVLPPTVQRPMAFPNSIYLPKERVAQIKFSRVGDGFYPVGLIEPIYKTTIRKMNIEESYATSVYRYANPILRAKLGDLNHQPTPNQIKEVLQVLKNLNSKNEVSVPYYYDVDYLQPNNIEKMKENFNYFIQQQVAGLGIPYSMATGGSENANAASLGNQSSVFALTLKQIISSVTRYIEQEMFAVVSKYEGFKEIPKLKWNIDTGDELNDKASRIMKYSQAGMITYSKDVENMIRKSEGFMDQK